MKEILVVYKNNGNSGRPEGVVGTVTGTTISFGVAQQADSATASYLALTYNTNDKSLCFLSTMITTLQMLLFNCQLRVDQL